jgi:phospholipid/cholesterol/gamma-HCH transport system substrate-binding protein
METRANYLMIGGFVLGVIMLAFLFVFWMSNFGSGGKRYFVFFEGVGGLTTGSNVLFNGLKVGEVQSLALDPTDTRKVRVQIGVRGDTPVRINSRATLQSQGLTGGPAVAISPGTPDAELLAASAETPIPVIRADVATSQSLFDAAPEVMGNANALLVRLNNLVADNEDSIRSTLTNVEGFTAMLNERRDDISQVIVDARELTEQLRRVADKAETTVDKFATYLTDDGTSFMAQAQDAAESFRRLANKLETSLGDNAEGLTHVAKSSLQEFEQFMREGRRAAQSLDRVLEKFERDPRSFLLGGSQVPEYNPR